MNVKLLTVAFVCLAVFTTTSRTQAYTSDDFVITVDTTLPGITDDDTVEIQLSTEPITVNFDVDWGDGTIITYTGSVTSVAHTYATSGVKTIVFTPNQPNGISGLFFLNYGGGHSEKLLTVEQWGTNVWSSMEGAFYNCQNLTITATDAPNLSNVTSLDAMFSEASQFNSDLSDWDVSNVTSMSGMFYNAASFNQPLNSWDVSGVTDMSNMFAGTETFNQPLDNWNVSSVTDMSNMFADTTLFNQPLDSWDVSGVTDMNNMFAGTEVFNQPLDNWNVSSVTDMRSIFKGAASFNQPLNSWDVSSVTDMNDMFSQAPAFNQPLDSWDVSGVRYDAIEDVGGGMSSMFSDATSFNQPLDSWDVSGVVYMDYMFTGASAFNQPLDNWNIANVTSLEGIFLNSALSEANYTALLNSWSLLSLQPDVYFGADAEYCNTAQAARDILTSAPNNWVITDGGATPDCVIEVEEDESESSGGSSGTRVGERMKNQLEIVTTSTPAVAITDSLLDSVAALIDRMRGNDKELKNLPAEEKQKLILLLQAVVVQLLALLASL